MEIIDSKMSIHLACLNCNIDEVKNILNENISDVNLVNDNDDLPIKITIKSFFETNNAKGDLTPKYFDNPYVKIIILLINNGTMFTSELLHSLLFNDKPIFSMSDFLNLTTSKENKFPIHNAIELCYLCKSNIINYNSYKKEYTYLQNKFKEFILDILDECKNINEGKEIILLKRNNISCIDLALEYEDKDFIANKYVQTVFDEKWYESSSKYTTSEKVVYSFYNLFLLNYDWFNIPVIKFYTHTLFNLIFLFLLYIQTYTITEITPTITELIIFIWIFGYTVAEINQFNNISLCEYFSDIWNYFDIFGLSTFLFIIVIRIILYFSFDNNSTPDILIFTEHLFSLNIILSYLRILNICQIHYILGPILLMLKKMIKDMVMFFCILSVFLLGFSLGITKIYHRIDNHEYNTISKTSMALFCALFGDFEMSNFTTDTYYNIELFGTIIFINYLIIAVIILINLFIAILSNSYSIIQEDSDKEWKYSRVTLIITYSLYSPIPSPLNIIYRLYNLYFYNKKIEPVIYNFSDPKFYENSQKIINRYYDKLKMNEKEDLNINNKIDKLQNKIDNLSSIIFDFLDLSPKKIKD